MTQSKCWPSSDLYRCCQTTLSAKFMQGSQQTSQSELWWSTWIIKELCFSVEPLLPSAGEMIKMSHTLWPLFLLWGQTTRHRGFQSIAAIFAVNRCNLMMLVLCESHHQSKWQTRTDNLTKEYLHTQAHTRTQTGNIKADDCEYVSVSLIRQTATQTKVVCSILELQTSENNWNIDDEGANFLIC